MAGRSETSRGTKTEMTGRRERDLLLTTHTVHRTKSTFFDDRSCFPSRFGRLAAENPIGEGGITEHDRRDDGSPDQQKDVAEACRCGLPEGQAKWHDVRKDRDAEACDPENKQDEPEKKGAESRRPTDRQHEYCGDAKKQKADDRQHHRMRCPSIRHGGLDEDCGSACSDRQASRDA
jgi:hypothetical protein